jgi:hypothetical protein
MRAAPSGVTYGATAPTPRPGPGSGVPTGLPTFDVPKPHRAIHAARGERAPVRADREGVDVADVAREEARGSRADRRADARPVNVAAGRPRVRRVAIRRSRLPAQGDQVALPDRRMQARLGVDQGRPPAPADPARDSPLDRPLPRRAAVGARARSPQERVGAVTAPRPWLGSGPAARRPDDRRQARLPLSRAQAVPLAA